MIKSHMLTVHTEGIPYLESQNRTCSPETKQVIDSMHNRHVSCYKYYLFSFHIKICQWVPGFSHRCSGQGVRLNTHLLAWLQIPDFCPLTGHNPGLLLAFTGHNTLRRHLHLLWLTISPLCRRWGAEDEASVHIHCECAALAALRHVYLGSFFLDPKDI